jgi:hypothetical protein
MQSQLLGPLSSGAPAQNNTIQKQFYLRIYQQSYDLLTIMDNVLLFIMINFYRLVFVGIGLCFLNRVMHARDPL